MRRLGGHWSDRELAVTLNRMRCRGPDGQSWTMVRVKSLREQLGIAPFEAGSPREEAISVDATARRLGICVGSVHRLIRQGVLPATQLMPSAPWQVPVTALATEAVQKGVRDVIARRPKNFEALQEVGTLRLEAYEGQNPGQGLRFGDGCLWDPLENADFFPRPYPAVR